MSLLVLGSFALDDVTTPDDAVLRLPGGSALYASFAASLFTKVAPVSAAGGDFPVDMLDALVTRGVDLSDLTIVPGMASFAWGCAYDDDLHHRRTTHRSLNIVENFAPVLTDEARRSRYVFLASDEPERQKSVLEQIVDPAFVALDTIECYIGSDRRGLEVLLGSVDLLFVNDDEATMLTGHRSMLHAARSLRSMGPSWVVVKTGWHGSFIMGEDVILALPACPIERVVDPTGAGDVFAGAAVAYIARCGSQDDETLRMAIAYGTVTASFVVEDFSVRRLLEITAGDVERRLDTLIRMTTILRRT